MCWFEGKNFQISAKTNSHGNANVKLKIKKKMRSATYAKANSLQKQIFFYINIHEYKVRSTSGSDGETADFGFEFTVYSNK